MLIQGRGELFSRAGELLLEVICLEGEVVPFVLEGGEQRGDGGECGRARADDARGVDGEEVFGG